MKKVNVDLGAESYEVLVGSGLLPSVGPWLKERDFSSKVIVITDTTVKEIYINVLQSGLTDAGFHVEVLDIPEGEEQKSLESAGKLYDAMAGVYAERSTPVLALGGGVVGDLAGFVAATYMRGVPLIQIPTTLLSQVDSSVGGKTAVDHGQLKNIVGAFYQPRMVVADIDTLNTLPEIEIANGMAEVIKSAAIKDRNFFQFLEANIDKIKELQPEVMEEVISRTVKIKAQIVEEDEREKGLRGLLNYGHTIGHAIEAVSDFRLKHGQAVAIGMVAAARISNKLGILAENEVTRLEDIIRKAGLPTEMPDFDRADVLRAIKHDKKVRQDKVRFILLESIGSAFISDDVDPEMVEEVIRGWD